jgi:hypothetical protein
MTDNIRSYDYHTIHYPTMPVCKIWQRRILEVRPTKSWKSKKKEGVLNIIPLLICCLPLSLNILAKLWPIDQIYEVYHQLNIYYLTVQNNRRRQLLEVSDIRDPVYRRGTVTYFVCPNQVLWNHAKDIWKPVDHGSFNLFWCCFTVVRTNKRASLLTYFVHIYYIISFY